jgi:DNA-binding NtrC family response regulator
MCPHTDRLDPGGAPRYAAAMDLLASVLVVDDDPDVLQAAELALDGVAHRVDAAATPEQLAARLKAGTYECALLDMNFSPGSRGGQEGMAALAEIRAADPTLGVVLVTAYGAVTLAVEGMKAGAADFLLKPWRNDALVAAVRRAAADTRAARRTVPLDALERAAIAEALARHGGNVAKVARALGLSRPTLYRRMERHGL